MTTWQGLWNTPESFTTISKPPKLIFQDEIHFTFLYIGDWLDGIIQRSSLGVLFFQDFFSKFAPTSFDITTPQWKNGIQSKDEWGMFFHCPDPSNPTAFHQNFAIKFAPYMYAL